MTSQWNDVRNARSGNDPQECLEGDFLGTRGSVLTAWKKQYSSESLRLFQKVAALL